MSSIANAFDVNICGPTGPLTEVELMQPGTAIVRSGTS